MGHNFLCIFWANGQVCTGLLARSEFMVWACILLVLYKGYFLIVTSSVNFCLYGSWTSCGSLVLSSSPASMTTPTRCFPVFPGRRVRAWKCTDCTVTGRRNWSFEGTRDFQGLGERVSCAWVLLPCPAGHLLLVLHLFGRIILFG